MEKISNNPPEEQKMEVSPPEEKDSNVSQNESPGTKEPKPVVEVCVKDAKLYLNKVNVRFKEKPQIFGNFLELLKTVRAISSSDQNDLETNLYLAVCELFQGHDDLIEEFKLFIPNATFESPEEVTLPKT